MVTPVNRETLWVNEVAPETLSIRIVPVFATPLLGLTTLTVRQDSR